MRTNSRKHNNKFEFSLTDELVPALGQLRVVREAPLHDVDAVVRAGPHLGDPLAGGARRHLGQGHHALGLGRDLKKKKKFKLSGKKLFGKMHSELEIGLRDWDAFKI